MIKFKQGGKPALFIELAKPDETGNSRKVFTSEFVGKYAKLNSFGNGGDWCRSDGNLAKIYIVERFVEKGSIVAIQLFGLNTKKQIQKQIRSDIVKEISYQKCAVLNISNVEVDHKDGHRDDYENLKPENQKLEDFQPLSPAVNKAKRQHCKVCRETKQRFDGIVLGFSKGAWAGNGKYRGTYVGCYWHDVKKFNQEISRIKDNKGE